jgi:hypothetical protein
MVVFACIRCRHRLTGSLVEVVLPPPVTEEDRGDQLFRPARMPRGTFANAPDGFVLHPEDLSGVVLHPDGRRRGGCCGLDGLDGPNLVCAGCGSDLATKQSDCWSQQQVTLIPAAVRSFSPPDPEVL